MNKGPCNCPAISGIIRAGSCVGFFSYAGGVCSVRGIGCVARVTHAALYPMTPKFGNDRRSVVDGLEREAASVPAHSAILGRGLDLPCSLQVRQMKALLVSSLIRDCQVRLFGKNTGLNFFALQERY